LECHGLDEFLIAPSDVSTVTACVDTLKVGGNLIVLRLDGIPVLLVGLLYVRRNSLVEVSDSLQSKDSEQSQYSTTYR